MSSLLAGGDYRLRSESALLGDRHCVILEEPGIDALWLDAVPPHLVLRREVFNDQTGALAARYDFSGHSHHGGDVWLPRRFTNQLFDSYASSKESQERLVIDAKLEINQLRVNGEVVEEDFHLELPAGTVRSVVRDGIEHFDPLRTGQREHAKAMTKWAAALAGNRRQSSPSIPGYRRIAAWAALGLVVGLGVGLPSVFAREKRNVAPGEEACRRDELVRDTEQNIELLLSNNSIRRTGDQ